MWTGAVNGAPASSQDRRKNRGRIFLRSAVLVAVILVVPWGITWAGPAHELKLATVIPDGTPWTNALNDVARKIYQ